ncbi:TetR/AcrR family transcriptional regulator [Arthrobacter sp. 35W]|uniref:TetR/AcrR family transcriptional regulator n=1 Tax=Arthrobacter sp. 35W TaxID=1132441 RepID=UPI000427B37E|nr:TetR/AcrR family transcriptional regulator [Arthrobacter sp. 35W]
MPPAKTRGPYTKGTERREQIIKTATDVFATEGFEGTALKRVAELVGVKEATLFHYFRGKQELLTAVLAERDKRGLEMASEDQPKLEHLHQVADQNRTQPGLTTLYAVASATANSPGHDSHEYFRDRYAWLVEVLGVDIAAHQAAGTVRTDLSAEALARLVIATFDGIQMQWLYDKTVDMAQSLRDLVDVLLAPR